VGWGNLTQGMENMKCRVYTAVALSQCDL